MYDYLMIAYITPYITAYMTTYIFLEIRNLYVHSYLKKVKECEVFQLIKPLSVETDKVHMFCGRKRCRQFNRQTLFDSGLLK